MLFLSSGGSERNDNHERLPRAFAAAGWRVAVRPHESLYLARGRAFAGNVALESQDLVWPVGFGERRSFLDRMQILETVEQAKLVTPARAWLALHGKTAFLHHGPPAVVARQPEPMLELMAAEPGDWVLKPAAGSFGRDVTYVSNDAAGRALVERMLTEAPGYWVLQRYLPDIVRGEIRTLVAAGGRLGSYLRRPTRDIRANLALDAEALPCEPGDETLALVARVVAELERAGVGFAAIDTVGDQLIEVNVANPGGLETLTRLYGRDAAADVVAFLTRKLQSGV